MGVGREAERGSAFVLATGLMDFSSLKFRIIQVEHALLGFPSCSSSGIKPGCFRSCEVPNVGECAIKNFVF